MKIKSDLLTKILKACLTHAGKKDVRYYLNGVNFKFDRDEMIVVGTDGHRIIEFKHTDQTVNNDYFEFTLDRDNVSLVIALCKTCFDVDISASHSSIGKFNNTEVTTIDGRFPDTRRLFKAHDQESNKPLHDGYGVNFGYLSDVSRALTPFKRKFNIGKLEIKDSMTSLKFSTTIDGNLYCRGLIMPTRL